MSACRAAKTTPPPASLADEIGSAERKAENLAGHIMDCAASADPIAARHLRRIGLMVRNDAAALARVRISLEVRS